MEFVSSVVMLVVSVISVSASVVTGVFHTFCVMIEKVVVAAAAYNRVLTVNASIASQRFMFVSESCVNSSILHRMDGRIPTVITIV